MPRSPLKIIFLAGLLAGTLDMSGTLIVYSLVLHRISALVLLRRIASAAFGPEALNGGWATAGWGLLFHYIIAYSFTTAYVLLYPRLTLLRKNKWLSGFLYGLFVWLVMNRIVLPMTKLHLPAFQWSGALIAMALLIVCIGLPVAWITDSGYRRAKFPA